MFALRRRPLYHLSLLANWGHKVVSRPFGDKFEGGLPDMSTQVRVKELIGSLKGDERQLLYDKLRETLVDEELTRRSTPVKPRNKIMAWFSGKMPGKIRKYIEKPTSSQLGSLFAFHSLPYIAFGCMDNMIMITAGGYIETTLGSAIGLSTLASAALGNTLANSTSIAVAYHVERFFTKRIKGASAISVKQYKLRRTRLVIQSARIIGIITGCFLGMTPLLFIRH